MSFQLEPIAAGEADQLRQSGGQIYIADEKPGYPCRQCLRDAEVGETLVLVSHDPFCIGSPYRSASPIFLHQGSCGVPTVELIDSIPDQLSCRQLSVRLFDAHSMMLDAAVIDGSKLQKTIDGFFTNPSGEFIHVHNATRGCWAVTALRIDTGG
jgi:Protein of unknown function (DUF1203)